MNFNDTMTINLASWKLEEIKKYNSNRSAFIRNATWEYIEEMWKVYWDKEIEYKVLTFAVAGKLKERINLFVERKFELSGSELVRNAVRRKLLLLREEEEKKIDRKIRELEEGYIIVPDYNGGKPFKTRRLE